MYLSDLSVKRPVLAIVLNLILIAFGIIAFFKLPLREYPNIDLPIISIDTIYPGAAASVVETRITEIIEDRIAGIEGIKSINSASEDGRSTVVIEFKANRDIDNAANDVRDRVASISADLPDEALAPEVQKANTDDSPIIWMNLGSDKLSSMDLTDYADRYVVDRFSTLEGVARIRLGGAKVKSIRIWIDRTKLAARQLTVSDIEQALESENIELPAGRIESFNRDFTVRIDRSYKEVADFQNLVLSRGKDGYLVKLLDVARVEQAPEESRGMYRGNGIPTIGIGVIKQSTANTLEVARLVKEKAKSVSAALPEGMSLHVSFDSSIFIESAIKEVYKTLFIAIGLVILIIYLFLGNFKATLIPAVSVPVSIIATFMVLLSLGYTINLLTLLGLVLAIGLVVDDAIVVLENVYRRIEMGETRLVAAYQGARQVGFAVIATTLVVISVFIPITFLEGDVGRLFTEFSVAISAAVGFSGFVALTLSPALASKILEEKKERNRFTQFINHQFDSLREKYIKTLQYIIKHPRWIIAAFILIFINLIFLYSKIPSEFMPKEDRGVIFLTVSGPEGSSDGYTTEYMLEIEQRLMKYVESGEIRRLLIRTPQSLGGGQAYNNGIGIIVLSHWDTGRQPIWHYLDVITKETENIPGVLVSPVMPRPIVRGFQKPVQFVLGGATYDELAHWRDVILQKINKNPKLLRPDHDYKETNPQIEIKIDRNRAADLGISILNINRTLETMLGSRRVTTYIEGGQEYYVMLQGEKFMQQNPIDLTQIYVRSERTQQLIPLSNMVTLEEHAAATKLNRYNRLRSITIDASLAEGYTLGEALEELERLARAELPPNIIIDYKGESLSYKEAGHSIYFVFTMSLIILYLVMAAQFESFVHPFVIMFTVPLAISGALLGLWMTGLTLNIYSQIGLIMLVGLATKNGILIVEFANQLRATGLSCEPAIVEAASKRLRPILMTSMTTIIGAIPLVLSFGAGAETRIVLGTVIISGVAFATFFSVFIIPFAYAVLAKRTRSSDSTQRALDLALSQTKHKI